MQRILGVFFIHARREENHFGIGIFQDFFGQVYAARYRWLQQKDIASPGKAPRLVGRSTRGDDRQVFRSRNSLHYAVAENRVDIDDTNADLVNHRLSPCPKD
jgi:hypothetical protein